MSFPLPKIDHPGLQKFCKQHNLYEAIGVGYHYAQKFFPKAKKISLRFREPYSDDEPESADIIFDIESDMTVEAVREAKDRFNCATLDVEGSFYIITSHRFVH